MLNEVRTHSTKRMEDEARELGADAIFCVRFVTSAIMAGSVEIMAYGTAVKFK